MVGTGHLLCLMTALSVKNISEYLLTALAAELSWTSGSSVSITNRFMG